MRNGKEKKFKKAKSLIFLVLLVFGYAGYSYGVDATVLNGANRPAHTQGIVLFNNISSTGASTVYDLGFLSARHTWMLDFSGSPTSISISLQGTVDGTNWFDLDTYTGTTDTMRHVVNKPIRKVRGNIATQDAGSVTVISIHGN